MTDQEMINEMFKMQKLLNAEIKKEFNLNKLSSEQIFLALFDELGELNHELKANWCWWKKSLKPIDKDKVLEELVDCYKFAITLYLEEYASQIIDFDAAKEWAIVDDITELYIQCIDNFRYSVYYLTKIMYKLGFEFEDVYNKFIEKNKVNYERLKNGY